MNELLSNRTEQNRTKLYLAKLRPYIWRKSTMHATYMNKGTKETKEKIKLYTGSDYKTQFAFVNF